MRVLLAGFGDAGHVFPIMALARALADRGHETAVETYSRWRPEIEAEGHLFVEAPEFDATGSDGRWFLPPFVAARKAVPITRRAIADFGPDVVVSDILTVAPALAAELEDVPVATLVPHVDPRPHPGHPPYSLGARYPATALGRRWWRLFHPIVVRGGEIDRDELNETRRLVGLEPQSRIHNGISADLALIGSFPQLEYPRTVRTEGTRVVGPLHWEPPTEAVSLPDGPEAHPLVLVAPSTAQDPKGRLLQAAVEGLAQMPVRLLVTTNRRPPSGGLGCGRPNMKIVDWLSYAQTMPLADVVVCHGGHGTLARALSCGAVPVIWPAWGDMAENAARADWAGAAVRVPRRFLSPRTLRLAVTRALSEPQLRERATELRDWSAANDPAAEAARLVEQLAAQDRSGRSVR